MTGTTHNGRDAQRTIEREWDDETPPSTALVRSVADARDVDPIDLPPLYDAVDADAMDALVGDRNVTMTVEYHGFLATVRGDGRLELVECENGA